MTLQLMAAGLPALVMAIGMMTGSGAAGERATGLMSQDSLGKAIFTGRGNCYVCHGANAKGGPLGPDLTDAEWLHIDGKVESIVALVKLGVPLPKQFPAPMLPMGGAALTDAEIEAVAMYIVSLGPKQ
ncbi:MAG: c-type cytochrome [Longimicrobiales bacterium]